MKPFISLFTQLTKCFDTTKSHVEPEADVSAQQMQSTIELFDQLAIKSYLRDSSIEVLTQEIEPLRQAYLSQKIKWHEQFDADTIKQFEQIVSYFPIDLHVEKLRTHYEQTVLAARQSFYDKVESNPLTEEQRLAVIRNNDRNLVLAAAGTGKTSVIVAKVLDLIESGSALAEQILVLAYNTAAAKELRERLLQRAQLIGLALETMPSIMTFHALGRMVLQQANVSTYLSVFVNDGLRREIWFSNWLTERLKTDSKALLKVIDISTKHQSPFNFQSQLEYQEYISDGEFRSLQDEKVDSYEELVIANWLFLHSVKYCYKPRVKPKYSTKIGVNHSAHFYLADGKDQRTHNMKGQDFKDDATKIEKKLRFIMKKIGVKTKEKPSEEIFQTLNNNGSILEGIQLYLKCLQAIRTEQLNEEDILKRLRSAKINNAKKQAAFLWEITEAYKMELLRQDAIDFDDMILRSIEALQSQCFIPKWQHILIDEFQDISGARMELINHLVRFGPQPCLTAVGDDWQAIYRFAGGKLELTTQFDTLVGSNTKTLLQKTFRYNNSIAEVAGSFVMQNPEQFKKQIQTHHQVTDPQVYLLDSRTAENENKIENRALQVVETIRQHDTTGSIAILARYRYLLTNAQKHIANKHNAHIHYWTFHGAKGLEADYCILLGFFKGKVGFPNQKQAEALLEALLPEVDTFPHSEERRLFYVALTRARRKSYIIADSIHPSLFVKELLEKNHKIYAMESFSQNPFHDP